MKHEPLSPPPRLKNRYRLVEWLGEGAMGTVYRALDETLGREVAIKFLSPRQFTGAEASNRFLREARVVARLSHPNIMALYDVEREADWHYLVLEYIPGQNLHTLISQRPGPFPLPEALLTIQDVLQALAYAHAQGVIHRDIKPENIMMAPDGRVKVTDFGLSLVRGDTRLTQEDTIVGTVLYLAPEVAEGVPADQRADLYAVGAVLYELLTGRTPFTGDNLAAIFSQILNKPVTPPRLHNQHISVELERVTLKLLAKNPAERYASAAEVLAALPQPAQTQPKLAADEEATPTGATPPGATPAEPLSLLEQLAHRSSAIRRSLSLSKAAPQEATAPNEAEAVLTETLLLYAAFEDTTSAVEAERRRLTQLLQSSVTDPLNLLLAQANAYEQSLGANPTARMAVSVLASLARQVIQQTRDVMANLHSSVLENLGLEPALETLADQMRRTYGLQVTLHLERRPTRLPWPIELAIFRAAQDALEHSVQQARASQVTVQLADQASQLVFSYSDNGLAAPTMEVFRLARQRIEHLGGQFETTRSPRSDLVLTIRFALADPLQLTPREMEVIQLLVEGLSNKEMARRLALKPRTVNFHLDNIYVKLGVNSRTEAAIYALRQGWLRPPLKIE